MVAISWQQFTVTVDFGSVLRVGLIPPPPSVTHCDAVYFSREEMLPRTCYFLSFFNPYLLLPPTPSFFRVWKPVYFLDINKFFCRYRVSWNGWFRMSKKLSFLRQELVLRVMGHWCLFESADRSAISNLWFLLCRTWTVAPQQAQNMSTPK